MIKAILIGAAGIATLFGADYLYKLRRLDRELLVDTSLSLKSISLSSLSVGITVTLKNPTPGTMTIKYPFVQLYFNPTLLGSSEVKDQNFTIPAYSQQVLPEIILTVSTMPILSLVTKYLTTTMDITLMVKSTTTVNHILPYVKTDYLSLRQANGSK
jgi:hypothetical protein